MSIRVVTYNVHRCLGSDGEYALDRIADVLAALKPDIIGLQELDLNRARSGGIDQAEQIALKLKMKHAFHPAFKVKEEAYGDAILSCHPMRIVKAGPLPGFQRAEPRGALWVELQLPGGPVQVFNTHLGLLGWERRRQVDELLGAGWMGSTACEGPAMLLGDLNTVPRTYPVRRLSSRLRDSFVAAGRRPRATFPTRRPLLRLDYIFLSPHWDVKDAFVFRDPPAPAASDHFPSCADIVLGGS